jgi:NAD(P)-dependent dehydrogenase (short-subunit alcohol dehydrogenase family)
LLTYYSFTLTKNQTTITGQPVALITGDNQGVGNEIVKAFVANGYVVYVGSHNVENREKAAAEIGEMQKLFSWTLPTNKP